MMRSGILRILLMGLAFTLPILAEQSTDCKVQVGMSPIPGGGVLLHISHDPAYRVTVEEDGEHLAIAPRQAGNPVPYELQSVSGSDANLTERLITLAKSKLGDRYQPAQAGPDHFDCSGFVYYLFRQNGIRIPRSSLAQSKSGLKLDRKAIRRGDILFFDTAHRGHVNHSGVYLGEGKFIHSSSGHAYVVTISDLDKGFYREKFQWGIRKIPSKETQ